MIISGMKSREILKQRRLSTLFLPSDFLFVITACVIALLIGLVLGTRESVYSVAVIGAIAMTLIVILRQDELAITIVIAVHIYLDWYWGLSLGAQIMEIALLLVFFFSRSPQYPWAQPRALWLWMLFVVLAIFPATHGIILTDTLNYYFNIIFGSLTIFWLGTLIARSSAHVQLLFKMLAIFGTLIAIHTIIQYLTGVLLFATSRYDAYFAEIGGYYHLTDLNVSRAGSILINPDSNGGFLAMMLFFPLCLFVGSSSLSAKLFYLAQILIMLIALLFTYSTGGWLAAGVAVLAFIAFVGYPRYRVLIPLCIMVAMLIILVFFGEQVNLQLQHAIDPSESALRFGAWQTGIQVILALPLTGLGLGRYVYFQREDPYRVPAQFSPVAHPHNSYIEIGALAGLPVLLIFLALLALAFWWAIRNWLRADAPTRTLLAGGISAAVALSANSVVVNGWTLIPLAAIGWLVLGVISSPLLAKNLDRALTNENQHVHDEPCLNSLGGG